MFINGRTNVHHLYEMKLFLEVDALMFPALVDASPFREKESSMAKHPRVYPRSFVAK